MKFGVDRIVSLTRWIRGVRLREGRVIQCLFYLGAGSAERAVKLAIFDMDGSGLQESCAMARANVLFCRCYIRVDW